MNIKRAFIIFCCLVIAFVGIVLSSLLFNKNPKMPVVVLETNLGDITVELDPVRAPITVDNFVYYVNSGHYNGTVFHRVINGFMIQGGGYTAEGVRKPTSEPIKLESNNGLKNIAGTIAMARTSEPDSATSQFFINTVDNQFLDYPGQDGYGYAVFGKVIGGMDVVKKIEQTKTGTKYGMSDWPLEDIVIIRAYIKQ